MRKFYGLQNRATFTYISISHPHWSDCLPVIAGRLEVHLYLLHLKLLPSTTITQRSACRKPQTSTSFTSTTSGWVGRYASTTSAKEKNTLEKTCVAHVLNLIWWMMMWVYFAAIASSGSDVRRHQLCRLGTGWKGEKWRTWCFSRDIKRLKRVVNNKLWQCWVGVDVAVMPARHSWVRRPPE